MNVLPGLNGTANVGTAHDRSMLDGNTAPDLTLNLEMDGSRTLNHQISFDVPSDASILIKMQRVRWGFQVWSWSPRLQGAPLNSIYEKSVTAQVDPHAIDTEGCSHQAISTSHTVLLLATQTAVGPETNTLSPSLTNGAVSTKSFSSTMAP